MIWIGNLEPGAGSSVNNHSTNTPFDIPDEAHFMYLESDSGGVYFEVGAGTGTNYDTFVTSVAHGAPLYDGKDPYSIEGAFAIPRLGRVPTDAAPAWAFLTAYSVGDRVTANGQIYVCTQAGTSTSNIYSLGPSAIGVVLADGTVNWAWRGPLSVQGGVAATPNKTVARIAVFNNNAAGAVVRVWVE